MKIVIAELADQRGNFSRLSRWRNGRRLRGRSVIHGASPGVYQKRACERRYGQGKSISFHEDLHLSAKFQKCHAPFIQGLRVCYQFSRGLSIFDKAGLRLRSPSATGPYR
jgi:hypothetical protein